MMKQEIINNAKLVAKLAHGSQMYSDRPYMYHLQMVVQILYHYGFDVFGPNQIAAGWLHDVVEDTEVTRADITTAFGPGISELVWACSGEGSNRQERVASINSKLLRVNGARPVKLADRMANIHVAILENRAHYLEQYFAEHGDFREAVQSVDERMLSDYDFMVACRKPVPWLIQLDPQLESPDPNADNYMGHTKAIVLGVAVCLCADQTSILCPFHGR